MLCTHRTWKETKEWEFDLGVCGERMRYDYVKDCYTCPQCFHVVEVGGEAQHRIWTPSRWQRASAWVRSRAARIWRRP